ncbi:MAG: hypothetical protein COB17_02960 [Sulfurimonas sp.]|nr:MAG: hypothetical protein COB17_02960 [Sulfurimonas sp.]
MVISLVTTVLNETLAFYPQQRYLTQIKVVNIQRKHILIFSKNIISKFQWMEKVKLLIIFALRDSGEV